MHLYSQLIQAETGDVIKQSAGCNQVVTPIRGFVGLLRRHRRRRLCHGWGRIVNKLTMPLPGSQRGLKGWAAACCRSPYFQCAPY